ncbi:DUF1870 family protein [Eikenella sp. S3360]|uniref:DUF1870 family protein n=1 Tax=Eikenella glucosivorans TaxID=2766967 RepID=A0ABS0NC73_9NEIS|nr:DUF1870 family protein [Eikenella glucosivorans]MBH5329902.1 DUF1870 family protein [Eikenella glucosivorans]
MSPIELKALRLNLNLTAAEAGQALVPNVDFPHGATAAEWESWEAGEAAIPLHVVAAVETRLNQKYQAIDDYAEQIARQAEGGEPAIALWYPDERSCIGIADWRISQSVAGEVAAMGGRVVLFDAEAYRAWREQYGHAADTPANRRRWAQEQFAASRA